jgi:hypothetical protein
VGGKKIFLCWQMFIGLTDSVHNWTTKELGGLGIRDFGTHNICLLLNLIHRLHCTEASAWVNWIREKADIANLKGRDLGNH